VVLIAFGAFKGYRSGWAAIISKVLSLLIAYVITFLFVGPFADFLSSVFPLHGLLATMVGGIVLFVITSLLVSMVVSKILKMIINQNAKARQAHQQNVDQFNLQQSSTDQAPSTQVNQPMLNKQGVNDAIIGALLGGILGAISGLFIGWVYSSATHMILLQKGEEPQVTQFEKTSKTIVNKFIQVAASNLGDDNGIVEGAGVLFSNPTENIKRLKRIQNSGLLRNFFESSNVTQALSTKNAKLVMQTREFQQLISNSDFIAITQQMTGSTDTTDIKKMTAIKITELWNQVEFVRQNHEFQDLLYSAEVQGMSRSYNPFAMLNSEKVARLLELIADAPIPEIRFEDLSVEDAKQRASVFRWVDKNGKVHYSDKKKQDN
jgi:hypothetical protein